MALWVQKYGGTSVADIHCIQHVARRIIAARQQGHRLVVVLSAMSGETDRLIKLAKSLTAQPNLRELDVLISTGEQVSIALLAMALWELGVSARSYMGHQVEILTDSVHTKARIVRINSAKILADLDQDQVVIVAGFQGIDETGNVTTLGRGGSDTTAVALAAAIQADECQIYTDVDGVYTTDPRVEPRARRLERITFEEMLEMASLGAKVLQIRAVEFAGKYKVPLRVLSTFEEGTGTLITQEEAFMEHAVVAGIAFNRDEAKLTIFGVPDKPGVAAQILSPMSARHIDIDMIVQNPGVDAETNFSFTVPRSDFNEAHELLKTVALTLGARGVIGDAGIVKISIVGVGMRSHAGIASKMFEVLGREGINIQLISTSEIKTSVVVDEKYLELGVRVLHAAFDLERAPEEETLSADIKKTRGSKLAN